MVKRHTGLPRRFNEETSKTWTSQSHAAYEDESEADMAVINSNKEYLDIIQVPIVCLQRRKFVVDIVKVLVIANMTSISTVLNEIAICTTLHKHVEFPKGVLNHQRSLISSTKHIDFPPAQSR